MVKLEDRDNIRMGEDDKLLEDKNVSVLDFDSLCATVAMQTEGKWAKKQEVDEKEGMRIGEGVTRMWEGELLDCFDHRQIAIQSVCTSRREFSDLEREFSDLERELLNCHDHRQIAFQSVCCPCYRFGKNMGRAGFGPCFVQGILYIILAALALVNLIAFIVIEKHRFLYLAIVFTILLAAYMGYYRSQIRRKFNIRDSDSMLDDCVFHLACPCCTLSQESRTLEINNIQDGMWHGRGDTICIGAYREGNKALFELQPPPVMSINPPS